MNSLFLLLLSLSFVDLVDLCGFFLSLQTEELEPPQFFLMWERLHIFDHFLWSFSEHV